MIQAIVLEQSPYLDEVIQAIMLEQSPCLVGRTSFKPRRVSLVVCWNVVCRSFCCGRRARFVS